jgi:hypothetical protein
MILPGARFRERNITPLSDGPKPAILPNLPNDSGDFFNRCAGAIRKGQRKSINKMKLEG